jgi:hypothetical protein
MAGKVQVVSIVILGRGDPWIFCQIRASSERGTTSSGSRGTSTGQLDLGYLTRREFRSDLSDVGRRRRDRNCKKREKRFREEFSRTNVGRWDQIRKISVISKNIYREYSNDKRLGMTQEDRSRNISNYHTNIQTKIRLHISHYRTLAAKNLAPLWCQSLTSVQIGRPRGRVF